MDQRWAEFDLEEEGLYGEQRRYHLWCLGLSLVGVWALLARPLYGTWQWGELMMGALPAMVVVAWSWPVRAGTGWKTIGLVGLVGGGAAVFIVLVHWVGAAELREWSHFAGYRAVDLGNGVNPLLPLLLEAVALVACAYYHHRRFVFASERFVPLPLERLSYLKGPYEKVQATLTSYGTREAAAGAAAWVAAMLVVVLHHGSPITFEGAGYNFCVLTMLAATGAATSLSMVLFLQAWWELSGFLRGIEGLELRHVLEALPRDVGTVALFRLGVGTRSHLYLLRAVEALRAMERVDARERTLVIDEVERLQEVEGAGRKLGTGERTRLQERLNRICGQVLAQLLEGRWGRGDSGLARDLKRAAFRPEETFVAFRFLGFIRYAIQQLRNLLMLSSVSFVLQVLALSSYPFVPQTLVQLYIGVTFALLVGTTGYVLMGMGRDRTLKRLSTDPDGEDHPVLGETLHLVALPLVTFVATYFPGAGRAAGELLQPLLAGMK